MRNKLTDLNDVLFEQIERINDDDLHGSDLAEQISKSKAITGIASVIVGNAKVALEAAKLTGEKLVSVPKYLDTEPRKLGAGDDF